MLSVLLLYSRRRMQKLGASKITQVDFLPKEVVSYSKETQTPISAHLSEGKYLYAWWRDFKNTFRIIRPGVRLSWIQTV